MQEFPGQQNNNGNGNNGVGGQDPNGPKKPNDSRGNDGDGPKDSKLKDIAKDIAKIKAAEEARKRLEEMRRAGNTINEAKKIDFNIGQKIEKQMPKRSWSTESIEEALHNPQKTIKTRDPRWTLTGEKLDDTATAYYHNDGGYVVRNDNTGDIVQLSDKADPNWIEPWN